MLLMFGNIAVKSSEYFHQDEKYIYNHGISYNNAHLLESFFARIKFGKLPYNERH